MAGKQDKNFKLDYTNFNRMMNLLAKSAGKEKTEKIVKGELKGVLERCIAKTKSATAGAIDKRFVLKGSVAAMQEAEKPHNGVNYPEQSPDLISRITFEGNRKFNLPSDITASNFSRVKKRLQGMKKRRKSRVGLAKSTFLFIADKAGIKDLKASGIAKARKAYAANPQYGADVTSVTEKGQGAKYTLTFETTSATVYLGTGGKRVIQEAINGRVAYFEKNVKKGVLDDPKKFAEQYGFIFD